MARFVEGTLSRDQAMEELQIGKTRLYELRGSFLAARADGKAGRWLPGVSGGDHAAPWPDEVQRFLRRVLSPDGQNKRYSYAFAASEAGRLFGWTLDRAQVRHWAINHDIKIAVPRPRPPAHARRWQRTNVGELWQLDATPDHFLGRDKPMLHLLDMLDDCSRMQVGCKLFRRECVAAYLDLFYTAFLRFGLPLQIYVDKAGFFRDDAGQLTQLGRRLRFYDISFVFANAPESKARSNASTRSGRIVCRRIAPGRASTSPRRWKTSTNGSPNWWTTATASRSTANWAAARSRHGTRLWRRAATSCGRSRRTGGGSWSGRSGAKA